MTCQTDYFDLLRNFEAQLCQRADRAQPAALRLRMTVSCVFALIMTVSALSSQLPRLLTLLGG